MDKITVNNKPMLNAYPDSIGGTLSDIVNVLKKPEFEHTFSSFYILPSLFNTDLDRGFSVISYDLNESLVKAEDLKDLEKLGIDYEMRIISAHREPDTFFEYAKSAESRGMKVIIAGAGKAAHLPGMCAAIFPLPVIGIPMKTSDLGGVDSLYSIVQMPSGIPVATVAINGGKNAGILAAKILAASDADLLEKLKAYSEKMKTEVESKAEKLDKIGYKEYLASMKK